MEYNYGLPKVHITNIKKYSENDVKYRKLSLVFHRLIDRRLHMPTIPGEKSHFNVNYLQLRDYWYRIYYQRKMKRLKKSDSLALPNKF